ncbi:MAG: hypothetical protein BRD46_03780, partial [Bacteroidetes bacterium QS_8_68_15]
MIRRYYRFVTDSERSLVWRLVGGALALAGAGAGALALALVVLIPFTPSTSDLEELKVQHPTVVKSAGGETIAEFGRLNREWVALSEMDPTVAQALVVTEDHRFYEHPGVDPKRLAGAVFRTLLGNRQGGSTLTMQLARNLYPDQIGQSFGPLRKLKEIVTALKIERAYSKDQIIETYLNTVSYLYGAHGIERGAQMYFDKSADKLDAEEAAMLVGMLKATAYYNPKRNPERARQRRNVVLAQMKKRGALTAEEYESLSDAPLGVDFSMPPNRRESEAPHFTERLREHLLRWAEERGYNVYTDGLVVHSTLDARLQAMAEEAVRRQGAALQAVADVGWARESSDLLSESAGPYRRARSGVEGFGYFWRKKDALVNDFIRSTRRFERSVAGDYTAEQALDALRDDEAFMDSLREAKTRLQVGFAAVEPEGAEVRAYVGSRDYEKAPYDHAGIARRQPGSTFKPFVYAAALEEGYDPDDTFEDTPVEIRTASGNTWRPENAGGTATGKPVSLSDGLAYSKNTITSRVVQEVGAGDVADLARDMGVRRSELDKVPSLALGTSSVTLLEMTNAYATLTRGGRYQEPQFITQIESRDGQVLRASDPPSERVLSEEVAAQITEMMRGVVTRGTGRAVSDGWGIRADVAGKTGTTQGGADGWFLLMHPQLVAGAWTGFNDPRVAFRTGHWGQGGNNALRVTAHFFQQALRSGALSPEEELAPSPESEEDAGGDGLLASVGDALESAAASAGRAAASAAESAGRAVVGAVSDWMTGEDGRRDAPADGSREEEPSAEQEQAQPRTWNETADERRKRMEEYWKEVQDERRRETERRRERLEQYYEETKENVEEAVPEDLPSPPGRDDRDERGDEAPPAERRGEDQRGVVGDCPRSERTPDQPPGVLRRGGQP